MWSQGERGVVMKGLSFLFVAIVLLSVAAGTAFAGDGPKFSIPAGSNQSTVDCGGGVQLSPGKTLSLNQPDGTVVETVVQGNCTVKDNDGNVYEIQDGKYSRRPRWTLKGENPSDGSQIQCAPVDSYGGKEVCRTPSLSKAFKSIDEAVLDAAQSVQDKQCRVSRDSVGDWDPGVGVEVHVNGYEKNNEFFYGDTYWYSDRGKSAESAPSMKSFDSTTGLKYVFSFHNHPNTKQQPGASIRSDFFSLSDWNAARSCNVPSYMMTCFLNGGGTTPRMLRLDPSTGDVHERAVLMGADGRLSYGGGWSAKPIYNFNGVLGWCECGNDKGICWEEIGNSWIPKDEWEKFWIEYYDIKDKPEQLRKLHMKNEEEYKKERQMLEKCEDPGVFYALCLVCGKVRRNLCIKPEEFSSHIGEFVKLTKSGSPYVHGDLSKFNIQSPGLCRIQDGKVVVKGVCKCSSPSEVKANFWTMVCQVCGRLVLKE